VRNPGYNPITRHNREKPAPCDAGFFALLCRNAQIAVGILPEQSRHINDNALQVIENHTGTINPVFPRCTFHTVATPIDAAISNNSSNDQFKHPGKEVEDGIQGKGIVSMCGSY
jgi:hypothetical protein